MTVLDKCLLNVPHKSYPLTPGQAEANYKELERWANELVNNNECLCGQCPEGTGVAGDKCLLQIPHKEWLYDDPPDPSKEFKNWKEIEDWATRFIQECGCTYPPGC